MKVDNEAGACDALHVSPCVSATRFASADDAGAILDTDAGVLPGARGEEGTVDTRDTVAVQADKLEH